MSITKRLHCSVPNVNRMRYRLIPVRILITHRRKYFVQMIHIRVSYVSPQYFIPLILLEAVLDVVCVEVVVALRRRCAQHQFACDKVLTRVFHCERRVRKFRVER